jgi:hypothetical protein
MADPGLSLPSTPLAKLAHTLVVESQEPFLRNHSLRRRDSPSRSMRTIPASAAAQH